MTAIFPIPLPFLGSPPGFGGLIILFIIQTLLAFFAASFFVGIRVRAYFEEREKGIRWVKAILATCFAVAPVLLAMLMLLAHLAYSMAAYGTTPIFPLHMVLSPGFAVQFLFGNFFAETPIFLTFFCIGLIFSAGLFSKDIVALKVSDFTKKLLRFFLAMAAISLALLFFQNTFVLAEIAKYSGNPSVCDFSIEVVVPKEGNTYLASSRCKQIYYRHMGLETGEKHYCDEIGSIGERERCIIDLAVQTGDIGLCSGFDNWFIKSCKEKVFTAHYDKEKCDQIEDPSWREHCNYIVSSSS